MNGDCQIFASPFSCPSSISEFERTREHIREALQQILGTPPFSETPELNPRILYSTDANGYIRKKVRYGNESDDVVWAWLLVPKHVDELRPGIICLPGSFMTPNFGKDGPAGLAGPLNPDNPEAYGRDLARLGYIVLCPDYPVAGERTTPGLKPYDTSALDRRFPTWTRTGLSVWDVSRAVDFLSTVDQVDDSRIGVVGWSQGGLTSVLGAALDQRITAVVSVCGWSPFRGIPSKKAENLVQPYNFPRLKEAAAERLQIPYDLDGFAALIAPRPFLDLRAQDDRYFPNIDEIRESGVQLRRLYELYGAAGKFEMYWFPGDHGYASDAARETQAWFYRWLWQNRR